MGRKAVEMKNLLVVTVGLCVVMLSVTSSAADDGRSNYRTGVSQSPISDSGKPNSAIHSAGSDGTSEQQEKIEDYGGAMVAITQRFSATLAAIAEAVKRGKISSEQGKQMSAEQYQLTQMQFQLLSLWREIEQQEVARIPDAPANPVPAQDGEIVMVALPFSSLRLNPSLVEYLSLTSSQVAAIQQVMSRERGSLQPLMTQMRVTREQLLRVGGDGMNEKEVKSLAQAESALLSRLIVANARMQSKIYRVLSPGQQKKLSDLERTQGSSGVKNSD